jgi:hypothetical protein
VHGLTTILNDIRMVIKHRSRHLAWTPTGSVRLMSTPVLETLHARLLSSLCTRIHIHILASKFGNRQSSQPGERSPFCVHEWVLGGAFTSLFRAFRSLAQSLFYCILRVLSLFLGCCGVLGLGSQGRACLRIMRLSFLLPLLLRVSIALSRFDGLFCAIGASCVVLPFASCLRRGDIAGIFVTLLTAITKIICAQCASWATCVSAVTHTTLAHALGGSVGGSSVLFSVYFFLRSVLLDWFLRLF